MSVAIIPRALTRCALGIYIVARSVYSEFLLALYSPSLHGTQPVFLAGARLSVSASASASVSSLLCSRLFSALLLVCFCSASAHVSASSPSLARRDRLNSFIEFLLLC